MPMRAPDALRALVDSYVSELELSPSLGALEDAMRYALAGGGKRIRPTVCLATTEAAGGRVDEALPAAAAIELVHTFSLVHDDLPSMDDDDERRGRPSTHVAYSEGVAVLAGDALLAEALRLVLTYERFEPARELAGASLGMIGGQYLDIAEHDVELEHLHRLKTGCLFAASVGLGLWVAGVPSDRQRPWRAFGDDLGLLFQLVDDVTDGDGYATTLGFEGARARADETADRTRARLEEIPADTSTLRAIVDELAASIAPARAG
jgi:geranylgeranyl diphosphate synthase, type II